MLTRLATVKIFDLLYLNGKSLLHLSTATRKRNMRSCLPTEVPGRIEYATEYEGSTAKDVRDKMNKVMESRGEGLVIKSLDAEYVLNGRNKDWVKVSLLVASRFDLGTERCALGQTRVYGSSIEVL